MYSEHGCTIYGNSTVLQLNREQHCWKGALSIKKGAPILARVARRDSVPGNTIRLLLQTPSSLNCRKFDFTCKLCRYWRLPTSERREDIVGH